MLCRYHFTTGKFPFEGDNVYKLFSVISTGVYELPQELPPLLKELIAGKDPFPLVLNSCDVENVGMLTKDPRARYSMKEIRQHP